MIENNFRRRSAGKIGALGHVKGSMSPNGSIRQTKQARKVKERQAQEMNKLNVLIGRLEERDTQQQAFATLIKSLPGLDSSLVKELYALIEKNKEPARSSTRRMLVLLIAALCRCHPVQAAKILPRILSYVCLRLRDRHTKTTTACVILVSAIALYILPCSSLALPCAQIETVRRRQKEGPTFGTIADVFMKEANAVGEAATKCLCGLLYPVDFDGVSVRGSGTILSHATRIRPFLKTLLADTVAKMDESRISSSFSPMFLLLQSACQLARDAYAKASFTQLGDDFAPYIASIYEAIKDAFQCGPRDNWMLRKSGLELLTLLLNIFVLQESAWCICVEAAQEYFRTQLDQVRTLVLVGRHDSISLVREAAIPAALAFERLEKLYLQSATEAHSVASANVDFVPPDPSGCAFTSKKWRKPIASSAGVRAPTTTDAEKCPLLTPAESLDEENMHNFDTLAGDEALPSQNLSTDEGNANPSGTRQQEQVAYIRSGYETFEEKTTTKGAATNMLPENTEEFVDLEMDQALVPEDGGEIDHLEDEQIHQDRSSQRQLKGSGLPRVASKTSIVGQTDAPMRPFTSATAEADQVVTTLKEFVAKQRAQICSRRQSQHQHIPQIARTKRRSSQTFEPISECQSPTSPQLNYRGTNVRSESESTNSATNLELTRAEAVLTAAHCDEYELAFRLCIVEDDLDLLRRMMMSIEVPCMAKLSAVTCDALCTAFLSLLDGDESEDCSDTWLVLHWLQQWAGDLKSDGRQFIELDPRVINALGATLREIAMGPTKLSLVAAHVMLSLNI